MKKINKIIISGIITLGVASASYAAINPLGAPGLSGTPGPALQGHAFRNKVMAIHPRWHSKIKRNFTRSWRRALHRSKALTLEQIKVVSQAAIILYGDSNMRIGKITPVPAFHKRANHSNYRVQITNQNGNVLNTVLVNGITGKVMPVKFHAMRKVGA